MGLGSATAVVLRRVLRADTRCGLVLSYRSHSRVRPAGAVCRAVSERSAAAPVDRFPGHRATGDDCLPRGSLPDQAAGARERTGLYAAACGWHPRRALADSVQEPAVRRGCGSIHAFTRRVVVAAHKVYGGGADRQCARRADAVLLRIRSIGCLRSSQQPAAARTENRAVMMLAAEAMPVRAADARVVRAAG